MSRRADELAILSLQESFGIDEALSDTPTDKRHFKTANFLVPSAPVALKRGSSKPEAKGGSSEKAPPSSAPVLPASPPPLRSRPTSSPSALRPPSELQKSAADLARSASTLAELRQAVESFEGCDLKKTAMSTVFSDGVAGASVMCIGEAPGADEDRLGKPFVGMSGQLLDKALATVHLSRANNVYIGNIIPWRPPGNRTPSPQESALCLPFIERHIELAKPKALVLLGGTAAKTLLQSKDPLSRLRGKWHAYTSPGLAEPIPTRVFFHPAYLMRSPGQKRLFWMDLLTLESHLKTLTL